jgi:hypothetical protein
MKDKIKERVMRRMGQHRKSDVRCHVSCVRCVSCVKCDVQPLT